MGRTGIGLVWLCLCCAIPSSFCQLVNVATGKTYSQSSYYINNHPASCAANGNTSGDYTRPNCIHTAHTYFAHWWQVDLGRKYPVYDITLWARTDWIGRLYPLNITVDDQLCVRANSSNREQPLTCSSAIYGQVVRLTRDRKSGVNISLNLCEVQIWVCPDGYYGDQCNSLCSSLHQCSQCYRNGTCAICSGRFKPPQCTGCVTGYHGDNCNSPCSTITPHCSQCTQGGSCTACSGNFQPPACTGCITGYHGNNCDSPCSTITPHCTQCTQVGSCTACSGNFQPPACTGCTEGYYGDQCSLLCSSRTDRCTHCTRDGQCTACSGHFQPWPCTACKDRYYKSGSTCVPCSSNCLNRQCDPDSGVCDSCIAGWYGDKCDLDCSLKIPGCGQCDQDGQHCTACKDRYYKSGSTCLPCSSNCLNRQCDPDSGVCDKPLEEEKESLVGHLVGAVVGSIVGVGLIAIIVTAVLCWRRKSNGGSSKTTTAVEMSSAAPANRPSDAAITGSDPPPTSSSSADVTDSIYEIPENDKDRNHGATGQAAPPTSSSSAEVDSRVYENEIQENNYDKLCVYSNDDSDTKVYTELADVTVET